MDDLLPIILAGSETLPALPNPNESEHWLVPAEPSEVEECVTWLVMQLEPDARDDKIAMLSAQFKTRDWTRAEWIEVVRELPFDTKAAHNYRPGVYPADAARIVERSRYLRALLGRTVSDKLMNELLDAYQGMKREHFKQRGFSQDGFQTPVYKFMPDGPEPFPARPEPPD